MRFERQLLIDSWRRWLLVAARLWQASAPARRVLPLPRSTSSVSFEGAVIARNPAAVKKPATPSETPDALVRAGNAASAPPAKVKAAAERRLIVTSRHYEAQPEHYADLALASVREPAPPPLPADSVNNAGPAPRDVLGKTGESQVPVPTPGAKRGPGK